jgi:hypothetical protein
LDGLLNVGVLGVRGMQDELNVNLVEACWVLLSPDTFGTNLESADALPHFPQHMHDGCTAARGKTHEQQFQAGVPRSDSYRGFTVTGNRRIGTRDSGELDLLIRQVDGNFDFFRHYAKPFWYNAIRRSLRHAREHLAGC